MNYLTLIARELKPVLPPKKAVALVRTVDVREADQSLQWDSNCCGSSARERDMLELRCPECGEHCCFETYDENGELLMIAE